MTGSGDNTELAGFLRWLDLAHEELAKTSPGVCACGSLLAPDGSCGVRPSTHEAMRAWEAES